MNIEAHHISIDGLKINEDISTLLDKYDIKNYADLELHIYSKNPEILGNHFLKTAFFEFKNRIISSQLSAEEIYEEHLKLVGKEQKLNIKTTDIDNMVRVTDLPIFVSQPRVICGAMYEAHLPTYRAVEKLKESNIATLKKNMRECVVKNGVAIPKVIYYRNGIGEAKYNQILSSLMFYDNYVDLLLEKYPNQSDSFYYLHDEKLLLVREKRKEIFDYLNDTGYEFVFGSIKQVMAEMDATRPTTIASKKLFAIEEVIANYVTFDEALDITSPKVLNKFIVSYGKR